MPKNKSDKLVNEQHHLDNKSQMQGNMSLLKISKASIFFTEQVKIPVMYASYICGSTKTLSSYAVTNMSSLTHTPTHIFNNTNFICGFTQEGCSTVLQELWRPQSAFSMAQKGEDDEGGTPRPLDSDGAPPYIPHLVINELGD